MTPERLKELAATLNEIPADERDPSDVAIGDCLDYIDELLSDLLSDSRWIPVTERLPDEMQYVICAGQYLSDRSWWRCAGVFRGGSFVDARSGDMNPTHWIPLPEPPTA